MKIAVFSDLHGSVEAMEFVKKISVDVDELWFLGDLYFDYKNNEETPKNRLKVYEWVKEELKRKLKVIVSGNCDIKETSDNEFFKENQCIKELFGRKFLIVHGHDFKDENKKDYLTENQCSALLYGHTHIGNLSVIEDMLYLNPGSVSFPRDELSIPSYILINTDDKNISLRSVDTNELVEELILH